MRNLNSVHKKTQSVVLVTKKGGGIFLSCQGVVGGHNKGPKQTNLFPFSEAPTTVVCLGLTSVELGTPERCMWFVCLTTTLRGQARTLLQKRLRGGATMAVTSIAGIIYAKSKLLPYARASTGEAHVRIN